MDEFAYEGWDVIERAWRDIHKAKLRWRVLLLIEFSPPCIQPLAGVM